MFNRIGIVSHRFDNDARLLTLQRDSGRERETKKIRDYQTFNVRNWEKVANGDGKEGT